MVWLLNAAVVAVLFVLYRIAGWIGPEACGGFLAGYFWCYMQFRCWRLDRNSPVITD